MYCKCYGSTLICKQRYVVVGMSEIPSSEENASADVYFSLLKHICENIRTRYAA
jgi:hypothetical protein